MEQFPRLRPETLICRCRLVKTIEAGQLVPVAKLQRYSDRGNRGRRDSRSAYDRRRDEAVTVRPAPNRHGATGASAIPAGVSLHLIEFRSTLLI